MLQNLQPRTRRGGSARTFSRSGRGERFAAASRVDRYGTPLARKVIGCAIEVHTALGPGLLESIYERCLAHELTLNGVRFVQQVPLPVVYKAIPMGIGFRVDFVIEDELLIEIKAVDHVLPVHQSQVLTYVTLLNLRQGL